MDFKLNKSNLSFNVKTAETMPDNPGANDFVIITPTPMKNWIMSPDMPTKAPRNDGDVCIPYSVNGAEFNAVKSGSILINPLTALQYANDEWKGVSAMVFPGGKKTKFLYNAGNECEDLTGGWAANAKCYNSNYNNIINPTLTKNENGLTFSINSGSMRSGIVEVQNNIDLTNVKSITFDFSSVISKAVASYPDTLVCSIMPRSATYFTTNATRYAEKAYTSSVTESLELTIDTADLTGSYDIVLGMAVKANANRTFTATCRCVKMEVE